MRYLLDTHTLIWAIEGSDNLPKFTKNVIQDTSNICLVSLASIWEISIKYSLGRLKIITDLESYISIIKKSGFDVLPIKESHVLSVSKLPFHHKDPFDRLIIAQAHIENLTLISKDSKFKNYNIPILWDT